jgi:predicted nucleic acid-binding protein
VTRYLLDTGPLTAYLLGRPPAVAVINPWVIRQEAATSILVYAEVTEYILGFADATRRQQDLRDLLLDIQPLVLESSILERYAALRRRLRPPHGPGLIGDIDTFICHCRIPRARLGPDGGICLGDRVQASVRSAVPIVSR